MENDSNETIKQDFMAEVIEDKKTEENFDIKESEEENNTKQEERIEEVKEEISQEKKLAHKEEVKKEYETLMKKKHKRNVLIVISVIVLLLLISFSTVFALINRSNEKIISGVRVNGINLKGFTASEAKELLDKKVQEKTQKEICIRIDDKEQNIVLSQVELEYDTEDAIKQAYEIGRNNNIFANNFEIIRTKILGKDIKLNYKYNEELLNNIITDIKNSIPDAVREAEFCVEDENLIITKGTPGLTIDLEELKNKIERSIDLNNNEEIIINTFSTNPKDINIEEIYNEVHKEAQDAYYTQNPFQIYAEVIGIDFNIEEAKEILKEEKDEYIIPLQITNPKKTVNDIGTEAFPDLISTFSTRYDASNVPRSTNLKLATDKLNGVVVMPGDTFSYNKTLGKRTTELGYKEAAGYSGGKVVPMVGGGICQISSTLYDAVVLANLEVVERHNHAFTTSYVGAGKDATVVYGSLDFKFKNTRNYPITLKASAQNGIAKIDIYGIKEETEYEIEISTTILSYLPYSVVYENDSSLPEGYEKITQYGGRGCKSITYKIFKLNGAEVSRTVLSTDTYDAMNQYVTRGTSAASSQVYEEPSNTEPTEEPTTTPQEQEFSETPEIQENHGQDNQEQGTNQEPPTQTPVEPENPTPQDNESEP